MKVLGLSFVRNARALLPAFLDSMAEYCDAICVVDDRSVDGSADLLRAHPAVTNVFAVNPDLSNEPWYFSEGWLLDLLYRMADFVQPDWIVLASADERIEPGDRIRELLTQADASISGYRMPLISAWDDSRFPHMVPVMGQARSIAGRIWRYTPGLVASDKRLHNSYFPVNIETFGQVVFTDELSVAHNGWSTLDERIAKVDLYTSLDPKLELNDGVPYDVGLLFGFRRHQIPELIAEYNRRLAIIRTS